jgi:hypothetical protein
MNRAVALVLFGVLLAGCTDAAVDAARQSKMTNALELWIGRTVADYAFERGAPSSTLDMGPGKRAFQWVITGQSASITMPVGNMMVTQPPQTMTCTVAFMANGPPGAAADALASWRITSYRWSGSC